MMRGVNDDEFVDLVSFAIDNELDISFIEKCRSAKFTGVAIPSFPRKKPRPCSLSATN